jgi:CRP-like cAMP-binding protein
MQLQKHLAAPEPQAAASRLVESALEQGGKDNATAVVVELGDACGIGDSKARMETLRKIPLFEKLEYNELLALVEISRTRRFEKGETVVREGEPGEEMFAIVTGRVQVSKAGVPLVELRKGGYFGELILFDGAPRSATAVAAEETVVVAIEREGLARLLQRDVELAVKLLWVMGRVMAGRLRNTTYSLSMGQQG